MSNGGALEKAEIEKKEDNITSVKSDDKLFLLYVNDLGLKSNIDYTRVANLYSKIILEFNNLGIEIANHFGNVLVLKQEHDKDEIKKLIDYIVLIDHNFRIGLHVVKKTDLLNIDKLNEAVSNNIKHLDVNELKKRWPKLQRIKTLKKDDQKHYNLFDENEIFGYGLFYTQKIANCTTEPKFVMSKEAVLELIDFDEHHGKINITKVLYDINKKLETAYVNIPVPFINGSDELDFLHYVTRKYDGEDEEKTSDDFYLVWRKEKREVEELYIGYAPFKGGSGGRLSKEDRTEIIKSICNKTDCKIPCETISDARKSKKTESKKTISFISSFEYPKTDLYYFDSIFSVFGYIHINFGLIYEEGNKKKRSLKGHLIANSQDSDYIKKKATDLLKESKDNWNVDTNRLPVFVALSSFPDFKDEVSFRKTINSKTQHKVYFRTEDIFDNVVIEKEFSEYYNNSALNNYQILDEEVTKKINTKVNRNESPCSCQQIEINNDDYYNNSLREIPVNKLFDLDIFMDNSWYLLIIFNLESSLLSHEQNVESVFKDINDSKKGINSNSGKVLDVVSYGILRGTWDGFILCHIIDKDSLQSIKDNADKKYKEDYDFLYNNKHCYGSLLINILKQVGLGIDHSYFSETISNCELFVLKTLIDDDWTRNLTQASSKVCDKKY